MSFELIASSDGTSDVEYVVEYDYPEGCEKKENNQCNIKQECGEAAIDPITLEPIEIPFFRATYYKKDNEGDPDTRGEKKRGECVNRDSLQNFYNRQPYTLTRYGKSIMNVDSVLTALPPVLTDMQILTRRLVAYIDNPNPNRLKEIEERIKGVDLNDLTSMVKRPHEEGEEEILRLYETLLDHFFNHYDQSLERCQALKQIISLLVEYHGVPYQKGDRFDEWNDTDFFHSLYYETREEQKRENLAKEISVEVFACLEEIKEMLKVVSVQSLKPTEKINSMVYK